MRRRQPRAQKVLPDRCASALPANRFASRRLRRRRQERLAVPQRDCRRRLGGQVEPFAGMADAQPVIRPVAERIADLVVADVDGQAKALPAQPEPHARDPLRQLGVERKLARIVAQAAEPGDQRRPRSCQ
jgi:hypothetical protein